MDIITSPQFITGVFSVVVALIGTGSQMKLLNNNIKKRDEAVRSGLRSLLRSNLYNMAAEVDKKGFIHVDELENFNDMYEQYKALDGNSIITGIHERLNNGAYEIKFD